MILASVQNKISLQIDSRMKTSKVVLMSFSLLLLWINCEAQFFGFGNGGGEDRIINGIIGGAIGGLSSSLGGNGNQPFSGGGNGNRPNRPFGGGGNNPNRPFGGGGNGNRPNRPFGGETKMVKGNPYNTEHDEGTMAKFIAFHDASWGCNRKFF